MRLPLRVAAAADARELDGEAQILGRGMSPHDLGLSVPGRRRLRLRAQPRRDQLPPGEVQDPEATRLQPPEVLLLEAHVVCSGPELA